MIEIPDYLKSMITEGPTGQELITSAGQAMPRISLKGSQFRFNKDGEEVFKTPNPIDVVIIGVQPESGMAKTFYIDGYKPGDTSPPDCSSLDGVRPDSWVSNPQSPNCASCQYNKWGSATSQTGKKAKACKDSKRLLLTVPKDPENGTLYMLNVTVSSLKALSEYGKFLVANHLPISSVITRISMVDADFPQISFEFKEILGEEKCKAAIARNQKKEWIDDFTEHSLAGPDNHESLPAPQQQAAPTEEKVVNAEPEKVASNSDDILSEWE